MKYLILGLIFEVEVIELTDRLNADIKEEGGKRDNSWVSGLSQTWHHLLKGI